MINKLSAKYDVVVIFVFSVLLYINSIFNGYVLDDIVMISANKFTKMGIGGIKDILTHDTFMGYYGQNMLPGGRYRPLAQIIFATEYSIFGLNPLITHLINVLIYGSLCVLLFLVLKNIIQQSAFINQQPADNVKLKAKTKVKWYMTIPFITAMLFAAHPLHTEVVANMKSLDEILSLTGSIGALYLIIRYLDESQKSKIKNQKSESNNIPYIYLLLSGICFMLALLAKENAITFLGIIPLTLFVFKNPKIKDYILISIPLLLGTVVYFIIRYQAEGFLFSNNVQETELLNNPFLNASSQEKNATIFLTIGKYLQLLIFPYPLTHDYYPKQIPIIGWGDLRAIIPFLMIAALLVYSVRNVMIYRIKDLKNSKNQQINKSSNQQIIAYGILFFIMTFSVQSNFPFNVGTFMNDRFMFAPMIGFCLIVSLMFQVSNFKFINQKIKIIILVVILAGYSAETISRNLVWKDEYTLFTTDVKTSSNSAKCNVSAGRVILEKASTEKDSIKKKELIDESLSYIRHGLEIYPAYLYGWKMMGTAYFGMKDYAGAMRCFDNALRINSNYEDALQSLAVTAQAAEGEGHLKEALTCYRTLLIYRPGNPDYLYKLASSLSNTGKQDTALIILNNLLNVKPDNFDAYNLMGTIYVGKYNDIIKALYYFEKAYSIKPNDNSILVNLGIAYGMKRDFNKSIEFFNKAIAINPNDAVNYRNLAVTYRNMGDNGDYEKYIKMANSLQQKKQ